MSQRSEGRVTFPRPLLLSTHIGSHGGDSGGLGRDGLQVGARAWILISGPEPRNSQTIPCPYFRRDCACICRRNVRNERAVTSRTMDV